MKYLVALGISLTLLVSQARAVVDGFAVVLNSSSATYTVPSGKVLILQQVAMPQGAGISPVLTIVGTTGPGGQVTLVGANTNGIYKFATPLHLPATVQISGPTSSGTVGLFGLLVDVSDMYLFTSVSSAFTNVNLAGNMLTGELRVATTQPVNIRFQSSTNLVDWNYDVAVSLHPGTDKTRYKFAAAIENKGRYYRAIVRRANG